MASSAETGWTFISFQLPQSWFELGKVWIPLPRYALDVPKLPNAKQAETNDALRNRLRTSKALPQPKKL